MDPISAWVIAHQKKEWGLSCRFAVPVIVREFHQRDVWNPIVLMFSDVFSHVLFHPLVAAFRLSVRSRVVCCRDVLGDGHEFAYHSCEFRCKTGVSVAYHFGWQSKAYYHVLKE